VSNVNKRMFIDTVRQYRERARDKNTSYAEQVKHVQTLYMSACAESGMEKAELEKEQVWQQDFIDREYAKYDQKYGAPTPA